MKQPDQQGVEPENVDEINLIDIDLDTDDCSDDSANTVYGPMLHTQDLRQIQADIAAMIRPTWRTSPPKNFGTPAQGKPKADEWRTSIEFDLPVSLVKLWANSTEERQRMIQSTMLLAMAI